MDILIIFLLLLLLFTYHTNGYIAIKNIVKSSEDLPEFEETIPNVTVAIGRDLTLPCTVNKLGNYRVAWIRVEDKGILTIHNHVITRNYRVSLSTNKDRNFNLHIRNVQEQDRGSYMCQINTVPMLSQIGYVEIVVPPDIVVEETSTDVITTEGISVLLKCKANGYPTPVIKWKREDQAAITIQNLNKNNHLVYNVTGETLEIHHVTRVHMGAYLCIASNGVPPSVSRRILLHVHFGPSLSIPQQTLNAILHNEVALDCHVEAYPPAIVFWLNNKNEPITENNFIEQKLSIQHREQQYKIHLRLIIRNLNQADFGIYKCLARNTLGEQQAIVYLQENKKQSLLSTNLKKFVASSNHSYHNVQTLEDFENKNFQNTKTFKKLNEKIYPVFVQINSQHSINSSFKKKNLKYFILIFFLIKFIFFYLNYKTSF